MRGQTQTDRRSQMPVDRAERYTLRELLRLLLAAVNADLE